MHPIAQVAQTRCMDFHFSQFFCSEMERKLEATMIRDLEYHFNALETYGDESKKTGLIRVVRSGTVAMIRRLLEEDSEYKILCAEHSTLVNAILHGSLEMLQFLVEEPVSIDVNVKSRGGPKHSRRRGKVSSTQNVYPNSSGI